MYLCVRLTLRRPDRLVLSQQMEAYIIQSGGSFMLFLFLSHHCSQRQTRRIWLQRKERGYKLCPPVAQQLSAPNHHQHNTHTHTHAKGKCETKVTCLHVFLWSILIVWRYDNVTIIIDVCNKAWPLTLTWHHWGFFWYTMCHIIAWNLWTAVTL